MSGRMNWQNASRWQNSESKYGANVVLRNGSITPGLPKDDLTRRAEKAMRLWQRSLNHRDSNYFSKSN
jgi:hypothetical protein